MSDAQPTLDDEPSASARVSVLKEVRIYPGDGEPKAGKWCICYQWCLYVYGNGETENGYRFIWRRGNGHLQAARGQARLPSRKVIEWLMAEASKQGWGDNSDSGSWPVA